MNQHSIVIGAEVDCCVIENSGHLKGEETQRLSDKSSSLKPPSNYVELKTSRILERPNQRRNFAKFKLRKFWAQSFLAGIPKVVCGFRDDDGVVREIKTFNTLDIPKIAARDTDAWDSSVCMNFCDGLLQWIKNIVSKDDPDIVYMFHFREPFDRVTYEERPRGIDRFLPEWFLNS